MSRTDNPDFIGIGAQRAASTWLMNNLWQHPQIMPLPIKELGYLNTMNRMWFLQQRWHTGFRIMVDMILLKRRLGMFPWFSRYLFCPRSIQNYTRLFQPAPGAICGEITPAYALMEESVVAQIAKRLPGVKIVFVMRDPVDRAWSAVKRRYRNRGKEVSAVPVEEILAYLRRPSVVNRGLYHQIIKRWESCFPADHLFVGSYDQIVSAPDVFLRNLFCFLGVDNSENALSPAMNVVSNGTLECAMPKDVEEYLSSIYLNDLTQLHKTHPQYAAAWLHRAQKCCSYTKQ